MIPVDLHESARKDLERISTASMKTAGILAALIQEMESGRINDRLLEINPRDASESVTISPVYSEFRQNRRDLWRLRPLEPNWKEIKRYRVIYAYIPFGSQRTSRIVVLAVLNKNDYDYEPNSPYHQRIIADYESLD